jgi:glycerophosphoryl diester phosphodiesterase
MNPLLDLGARPIIAHRGASGEAPENTLEAFRLALAQGADALEFDVHLSGDGIPMVIHDPTLDRTTDRTGRIETLTAQQIQQADAGARFTTDGRQSYPYRGRGIRVPRLAEVLAEFRKTPLLIEIKTPAVQDEVARLIMETGMEERCVLASDRAAALIAFKEPLQVGASVGSTARLYFGSLVGLAPRKVHYKLFAIPDRYYGLPLPTRRFVRAARRLGCPVHVWTLDDGAFARRLWARGVSGIVSNFPEVMRRAREAGGPLP